MNALRSILYVDDDLENLATLKRVLRGHYEVLTAPDGFEALASLGKQNVPVLVADQRMPKMTGVQFLKTAVERENTRVGLLLTAYADMDALIDGVNAGVIYRYLTKPWREEDLLHALRQAFERYDLVAENKRLMDELKRSNRSLTREVNSQFDYNALTGADRGLANVAALISKVAPTNSTVLIRGESGVGKELVARAIHQMSPRKNNAFIRVNCGALAESLLESELFGHEKGAFTGASERRVGRFEEADGGTIFLDEIGDVSAKLQVSLLRVIQEKTFERVGSSQSVKADIRIIAATHRNLEAMCRAQTFRQDLFFRLSVFPIVVPPLRARMADLPALVTRLLEKGAERTGLPQKPLASSAMTKLQNYDWPGNVRELENLLERALILSTGTSIEVDDLVLGPGLDEGVTESSAPAVDAKELTKEQLELALAEAEGNKLEAARRLGIKRPTLYYHLKRFGL